MNVDKGQVRAQVFGASTSVLALMGRSGGYELYTAACITQLGVVVCCLPHDRVVFPLAGAGFVAAGTAVSGVRMNYEDAHIRRIPYFSWDEHFFRPDSLHSSPSSCGQI